MSSLGQVAPAVAIGSGGTATTGSMGATTAGSTIVAFATGSAGASSRTFSDNAGNTWVAGPNQPLSDTSDALVTTIYLAYNITANAAHTVTFVDANGNVPSLYAIEVKGVPSSSSIDISSGLSNNASANPSNAVTTTGATELVIAYLSDGRPADTVGTGFTSLQLNVASNGISVNFAYTNASTAGSYDPAWTGVAAGRNNMLYTVAFKNASTSPVPNPNSNTAHTAINGTLTPSVTITGVTAGNTLQLLVSSIDTSGAANSTVTVSDGQGAYIVDLQPSGNACLCAVATLSNAAAGSHTVTATLSGGGGAGSSHGYIQIVEVAGLGLTDGLDQHSSSTANSTGFSSGPTNTLVQPIELAWSVSAWGGSAIGTLTVPPTGFTDLFNGQDGASTAYSDFAYQITSTTAAVTANLGSAASPTKHTILVATYTNQSLYANTFYTFNRTQFFSNDVVTYS